MNKILRLTFVALLAMVSNMGFAQDAQPTVTLDFTNNDAWKLPTAYTKEKNTYTDGTYTITLEAASSGYKFNDYKGSESLILGKKDATLTLPAFDFDVERIDIVGTSGASGKTTQNIFVGNDAVSTQTTGAKGTHEYKIAEASQKAGTIYTLKVTNSNNTQIAKLLVWKKGTAPGAVSIKNTPETAYTVAKAKELFDAGQGLDDLVYVKGIVSNVDSKPFEQYKELNIYISDDGQVEKKNAFEAYSCKSFNNADFAAVDAVKAGDKVVIYGKLTSFNGTYELGRGCYLYSLNGSTTGISKIQTSVAKYVRYNLAGQKVGADYKGVVIENGKKVVVK
uniref:hypothetical protein n=1 Tax=Prevotella sp. TaxID=59823 RepID=UPI00402586FA